MFDSRARPALVILFLAMLSVAARAETTVVGGLSIEIPKEFKLETRVKDPSGDPEVIRWRADGDRTIQLNYFAEFPKYPGQPIQPVEREDVEVAGLKTSLIRTEGSNGPSSGKFRVYLLVDPSTYSIEATRLTKEEFKDLIKSVTLQKKAVARSPEPTSASATDRAEHASRRGLLWRCLRKARR